MLCLSRKVVQRGCRAPLRSCRFIFEMVLVIAAAYAITACDRATPPEPELPPLANAEGVYQLRFNDKTVGEVFFALAVDNDGGYRIDAFTRPAEDVLAAAGQEIVEYSAGTLSNDEVSSERFGHTARTEDGVEGLSFVFDWQAGTMLLDNGERKESVALPALTQDRLSYLLVARRLALLGRTQSLQIVGPQGAEEATLRPLGNRDIEVPAGSFSAAGVARLGAEETLQRELWFARSDLALPLIVTQHHGDNRVGMRLIHYGTNTPGD